MTVEEEDYIYVDLEDPSIELDDLLLVSAVSFDDFNESDLLAECDRMMLCNHHIQRFYDGVINGTLEAGQIEVLGDVLAESGLDPYIWSENWRRNVQQIIVSGYEYTI